MKTRMSLIPALVAAALLCLGGCGDSKKKMPFGKPTAKKKRRRRPRRGGPPVVKKRRRRKIRQVELSEQDFVESTTNRDPFRSYMTEFRTRAPKEKIISQRNVLLRRYGLDELRLVAVVTGGVRARAMFRDPKGLGVTVTRGNYISKSEGRVKQILPGRVVVEIRESYEGEQKLSDRVIELHEKKQR